MLRYLAALVIALFSTVSQAHPGHDHSHWSSNLTHLALALSVAGIASVGVFIYRRKKQLKTGE
ncbi:hypothetical protein GCM10008107_17290 [Psychrosphaera saromensis]|uniref:Gram-positive cocci surface proteins LPxTG domain-containing protein n=1 Tax=Psychrosphaera saromensis TaxID=716813 RepID=A0A2S7USU8_9GAMM|nr:hypothetical protein [Psychrosphaera saromensis]PQJ53066.1 hypothetical protein BTO11_04930 [Psychrosphaera saromensis]GHB68360.1 hypothetical protein GCM10008107_17290 [Psychrosphaera saromensis]GLQ15185.1 hypothetical protein GCM10007917_26400 [Psychrosphaera saromensis]